jgi:DNA adenine methylase Dam
MIKDPFNFTGSKFNLLPQILPLFPKSNKILDLFGGGGCVGLSSGVPHVHYNDRRYMTDLVRLCQLGNLTQLIDNVLGEWELPSLEGYYNLRRYYNSIGRFTEQSTILLFVLICHSFNNYIRFNKKGEFNLPYGDRTFNANTRQRLEAYSERIRELKLTFTSLDFRSVQSDADFIYADPPYLIGIAPYNEKGGWTADDERDLYKLLEKHGRFAMSNVLELNGKTNVLLAEFIKRHRVHYLRQDYQTCNHQRKNNGQTVEVLVTGGC